MDDKAVKLFQDKNLVFISTLMKDGSPQLSPVWANYDDGHILVNTAEGRINIKMFCATLGLQCQLFQRTIHLT